MSLTKEKIELAVKEWQNRLNLNHWTVKIRWDLIPDDPDNGASIYMIDGRDYASVRFEHNIFDEPVDVINQWIAHELIHIHLNELYDRPYKMLDRDKEEVNMLLNYLHDEIEHVTDRIATAFANAMPLPKSLQGDE
jgi:hypothetical protein